MNIRCPYSHIVASDLDGSLVVTQDLSREVLRTSDEALKQIGALVINLPGTIYFGTATGRSYDSIQELTDEREALREISEAIDFHIASVGSAIYTKPGLASRFTRVPGWPPVRSWNREALVDRLSTHPNLTPQEPEAQEEHKISYMSNSTLGTPAHTKQLRSYLSTTGLQAEVIVSGGGSHRFVDVLPKGVNKGSALKRLPRLLLAASREDLAALKICLVAAGDSMNDKALLTAADVGIIPANGQPDLLEWAAGRPANSLYVADEPFAAGVLQGLQRHLFGR